MKGECLICERATSSLLCDRCLARGRAGLDPRQPERVPPGEKDRRENDGGAQASRIQASRPPIPGSPGLPGRPPVLGVLATELLALPFALAGAFIGARRGWLEGQRELRAWWSRLRHASKVRAEKAREQCDG